MKIALISPNSANLQAMAAVFAGIDHQVVTVEGGKTKMRAIAEQDAPDLILVEGMCCDVGELAQVEHVCTHHPRTAVVLLCATHTPEFLIAAMRAGVREVLPSPAPADALAAMAARISAKVLGPQRGGAGKVLAFVGSKGGSGTTFLAANVGHQLAERSNVLLVDLNLQFGDALGLLHDGPPASTLVDVARNITRLDSTLLAASAVAVSPSFSILAAPEDPAQAVDVRPDHIETILDLAVRHYDFVVLDMPRVIDTLTIRALDRAHRIFLVLQQALPSLRNAKQMLAAFDALGYPGDRTELVINRFDKGSAIGTQELRAALGSRAMRNVPNAYPDVSASIEQGVAVSRTARSSAVARTIGEMAEALRPRPVETRSLLDRLLKRA
ncbi:MAG: AAA family ATPase [Ramlibacter sp.]